MSFARKRRPAGEPPRWLRPRPAIAPLGLFIRSLLFAVIAIAGAAWALVRHYTHVPPPMLKPVAPPPAYDSDAGELPAPDFESPPRP